MDNKTKPIYAYIVFQKDFGYLAIVYKQRKEIARNVTSKHRHSINWAKRYITRQAKWDLNVRLRNENQE